MQHDSYLPHAACWLWNRVLIVLHGAGDLGTWACYMLIPIIAIYIYRRGRLSHLAALYPKLWRRGAGFVIFCGFAHLGSFLEIWVGGRIYYITGANKLLMLAASALFAWEFWRCRDDLVLVGLVMEKVEHLRDGGDGGAGRA